MKPRLFNTFARIVDTFEEDVHWGIQFNADETQDANATLQRTAALFADIGLNPDDKRSVEDISRLKTAIAWALGG